MKRRNFIKTSAAVTGLVASMQISPLMASEETESTQLENLQADNRSKDYLNNVRKGQFPPKPPVVGKQYSVSPMPLKERIKRKIVPQKGFCSVTPGKNVREALISGNGKMNIELMGEPYSEQILFHHEELMMPWKKPVEAPNVASIFPQVRKLILDGKTNEAVALAVKQMNESQIKQDTEPHLTVPAFLMKVDIPKTNLVKNYLRTLNFESNEIKVVWSDKTGDWLRQIFVSRPDNVVVQKVTAPLGKTFSLRISLEKSAQWSLISGMDWGATRSIGSTNPDMAALTDLLQEQKRLAPKGVEANEVKQDCNEQRLIYKCLLDTSEDNSGYAGVTRVVRNDGTSRMEGTTLVIENASSVMLLTRIEYFSNFGDDKVIELQKSVEEINSDYNALLERHEKIQSEMLNRVTVDFAGEQHSGFSIEELLISQYSRPDFSSTLLKKIFEMGRYWFIINSGKYPSIAAGVNSTINLQTAGAVQGNLKEGMEAYFRWMEEIAPDSRINAKNIFGFRGTSYPLFPDKNFGVSFYYNNLSEIGIWPYWISAGGWLLRHFWDHYLVTGDVEFLSKRVVPAYKELAAFYEDFLSVTDKNGNYIFVPSISPENIPTRKNSSEPSTVNATMDIAVCREVLTNLIIACESLGIEAENINKWKSMLDKMPPYLMEADGTLKEWASANLQERYSHRHISHLYGVWPDDEINPDSTPELAKAAKIADRRRTFDTMPKGVAGETLAAYFRCHRALVGARLKDNVLVDIQLRQMIEQGYVSNSLRCSRETYAIPIPDAQAGIPAIIMEMLLYSSPGVIEVLPALPEMIKKGSIKGMLARTFAKIDNLTWDMDSRKVELTVTSKRKQNITLIARHGIEEISVSDGIISSTFQKGKADCELELPENKPVKIILKLGNHKPADWIYEVA